MKDERILAGMDVCTDHTQITYFSNRSASPESLAHNPCEEQYLIPTRLALKIKKHEWIIGEDVGKAIEEDPSDVYEVKDLLLTTAKGQPVEINGETFESAHILQLFLRRVFLVLRSYNPYVSVKYVVFTSDVVSPEFSVVMHDALERFGIKRDRYSFISHEEALINYTIHQRRELWLNETALFELDENGLHALFLSINRDTSPMAADIEKKELPDLKALDVSTDPVRAGGTFETLAETAMADRSISTIYAVGRGFITDFADKALGALSSGRHVFRGQNLFAKGACYVAHSKSRGESEKFIYFDDNRIRTGISLIADVNGRQEDVVLIEPARLWYEAGCEKDIIVQDADELSFQKKDFVTKKIERRFISLTGLESGKDGITRLRISVSFKDRDTCIIRVRDLGFGTFLPTTNRVWEITWER